MLGSASPRNPSVCSRSRSSKDVSLDVACRWTAIGNSSRVMPTPLSDTRISLLPPSSISTEIRVAWASIAFSINSLTTETGRSTTSPAAIFPMVSSVSKWMGIDLPGTQGEYVLPVRIGQFVDQDAIGREQRGHRVLRHQHALAVRRHEFARMLEEPPWRVDSAADANARPRHDTGLDRSGMQTENL